MRFIESEGLDRMIFVGQQYLDRAIKENVEHSDWERSRREIGDQLVNGVEDQRSGRVRTRRRIGGMPSYYHRRAT